MRRCFSRTMTDGPGAGSTSRRSRTSRASFRGICAPLGVFLGPEDTGAGWRRVEVVWDCDAATARLLVDGRDVRVLALAATPEFGFSYMHIQTSDVREDEKGTYFRSFLAESSPA